MAAAQLKPTRRALLGAALGIPFLGAEGAPPPCCARSPSPSGAREGIRATAYLDPSPARLGEGDRPAQPGGGGAASQARKGWTCG